MTTTENTPLMRTPIDVDVKAVLRLIDDFSGLLQAETAALKKADFKAVDDLQAEKRNYARRYHQLITGLCERRDDMMALDAAQKQSLTAARDGFGKLLKENLDTLEAAKDGAKRLVNRILDAARRNVVDDRKTHYSNSGRAQSYKTATLSLSIDQKL